MRQNDGRGELREGGAVVVNSTSKLEVLDGNGKRRRQVRRLAQHLKGVGMASGHPAPACKMSRQSSYVSHDVRQHKVIDNNGKQAGDRLHCSN